ncbi:MAG: RsmD family RNA methyltransferase [Polyangiaceae bacterium]
MPAPICPVVATCGGCPWFDEPAERTRERKLGELRTALARHLGASFATHDVGWVHRDGPVGYRHRIRLRVDESGIIGFFNQEKSRQCAVLLPDVLERLQRLLDFNESHPEFFVGFCHLELRGVDLDGKAALCLYPRIGATLVGSERLAGLTQLGDDWLFGIRDHGAMPMQRLALTHLYHFVPLTSFLQVNRVMNDRLVQHVVDGARARRVRSFLDLFAGAGNFTLPLLALGARGTAIESDRLAIEACDRSARAQSFDNGIFRAEDARSSVAEFGMDEGFDLVIVDPPRAGLKESVRDVARLAKRFLVYVSCNRESLAKDLKRLVDSAMVIESITAFDLFERTDHLETCVWLRASDGAP